MIQNNAVLAHILPERPALGVDYERGNLLREIQPGDRRIEQVGLEFGIDIDFSVMPPIQSHCARCSFGHR